MKAPKTIYLATTDEVQNLDNSFIGIAHNNPNDIIEPIEYVRKDTFIEKVINFLEMLGYGFTITDNITKSPYDNIQLIEDFKKYMEK